MVLLIGIGNADRGDDAAGLAVARQVREAAPGSVTVAMVEGDQVELLDLWDGAARVYVADAVCSGGEPGATYRFDASRPLSDRFRQRGTHTFSLADVIELARAVGRLPGHLMGFGIEAAAFELGAPLSPEAEAGVRSVVDQILRELKAGE
jgi:hydrogenase maturation protease